MIAKIKNNLTAVFMVFALLVVSVVALTSGSASAATNLQDALCTGSDLQVNVSGTVASNCAAIGDASDTKLNNTITLVINIFSMIVGLIAVIMIIVGGLKYITSGGDSGKVTSAKNSIIYAIIGLVIVALAQIIVRFVLSKTTSA